MIDPDEVLAEALHDLAARGAGSDPAVNAARAQAKALIAIAATLRAPGMTLAELRLRTAARETVNLLRDPDFLADPADLWRREVLERLREALDGLETPTL